MDWEIVGVLNVQRCKTIILSKINAGRALGLQGNPDTITGSSVRVDRLRQHLRPFTCLSAHRTRHRIPP